MVLFWIAQYELKITPTQPATANKFAPIKFLNFSKLTKILYNKMKGNKNAKSRITQ